MRNSYPLTTVFCVGSKFLCFELAKSDNQEITTKQAVRTAIYSLIKLSE